MAPSEKIDRNKTSVHSVWPIIGYTFVVAGLGAGIVMLAELVLEPHGVKQNVVGGIGWAILGVGFMLVARKFVATVSMDGTTRRVIATMLRTGAAVVLVLVASLLAARGLLAWEESKRLESAVFSLSGECLAQHVTALKTVRRIVTAVIGEYPENRAAKLSFTRELDGLECAQFVAGRTVLGAFVTLPTEAKRIRANLRSQRAAELLPSVLSGAGETAEAFSTWCKERAEEETCRSVRVTMILGPSDKFTPEGVRGDDVMSVTLDRELAFTQTLHAPWLYLFVNDVGAPVVVELEYLRQPWRVPRDFHWFRRWILPRTELDVALSNQTILAFQPRLSGRYELRFTRVLPAVSRHAGGEVE
ncbi:hypothetical protein A2765_00320 [Candidatus Kaiserbacteria bacterium RIFCSPHIGHO2_01_FULL_56_24]|uniref:Uncharacterized protein n=1 Tax=Candidatus Kaiserbacteria bacterium RIFCSPHIGHO2_01_FULL_56_24 TaxID=1798487 RepID=A0A1F6DFX6_9BACT|nr:MAG: hypothetical protein A2765_00320 [Candidatus Kaiserbacteria bacterium RIFCSPHIGHO2_01_FULL_56_24]